MANVLTGLIPTLYEAMDIVGRELVGFIPSVYRDSSAARAAKDQTVRYPIVPAVAGEDIVAGAQKDTGDQTINYGDMSISKSRAFPVRITGEETQGLLTSGRYREITRDRFAQALRAAVNEIEADLAGLYTRASRAIGTAGTAPFAASMADAATVNKILDDNGCPRNERTLVIDTTAALNLKSLSNYMQAQAAGGDEFRRGVLFPLDGLDIRQSAQVKAHTKGTAAGMDVDLAAGYKIGDTTIHVDGGDGGTIRAGDVITFAGDTNKYLVQSPFAALQEEDLVIAKPGLLADLANTVEGTIGDSYRANMAFHKNAIHLVTRAPAMPEGGDSADDAFMLTDPLTGLSFEVRVYKQYHRIRYEVCLAWGCALVKPEFAAILLG
ncbi:MAG: P22 coat protein - gene protein 5 [Betaproteobacteria bacterium ADurb.Bin341]|nr:MAG: P22 coat protein - gene protein 5 [Betaproteobacteria bacterium ADurb.Bin341]